MVGLLYVFDYKDPGVVDAIVPTRTFDDYYLFGPPRPHVSPWRGCGELSLHLLSASPAAGRPVRAGTTSGEGGINNNNNSSATASNPSLRGHSGRMLHTRRPGPTSRQRHHPHHPPQL